MPLASIISREPLPPEKHSIIRPKDRRVAVAAPKRQGIVHLEKIRHPHSLPAPHEAVGDLPVMLATL